MLALYEASVEPRDRSFLGCSQDQRKAPCVLSFILYINLFSSKFRSLVNRVRLIVSRSVLEDVAYLK